LKKTFKPEFLNRIDDIIVFDKLTDKDIELIAEKMLDTIKERLQKINVDVNFTKKAIKAIAKAGFDEVYGARPLRRAIQSKIEDKLSEEILEGKISPNNSVVCDYDKRSEKFKFTES
ncbi:MAG: ATP-dependent Clp protease ATP-binding subunit, partial [Clostridia bacterium]|nr:ATP-dependent Clp protease ATP-binding subunit [Clostridia bacterium]